MKKIDLSKCPKYKQSVCGGARERIVTIVTYSKYKVTATCKEYDKDTEENVMFYHYSFMQTLKRESVSELVQKAKDYYNVKEEEKIN